MKKTLFSLLVVVLIASAVIFSACGSELSIGEYENKTTYDYIKQVKRENFTYQNRFAEEGQCVFIGDSIIEIYPTAEFFSDFPLQVYNRGISGDFSNRVSERLKENALDIHPAIMCVLVGTNDISVGAGVDTIAENFEKIVSLTKELSPQTKLVMLSVFPVSHSTAHNSAGTRQNDKICALNERLKNLAAAENVIFADLYQTLLNNTDEFYGEYTYDGLHPNAQGYRVISEFLRPILTELLP